MKELQIKEIDLIQKCHAIFNTTSPYTKIKIDTLDSNNIVYNRKTTNIRELINFIFDLKGE